MPPLRELVFRAQPDGVFVLLHWNGQDVEELAQLFDRRPPPKGQQGQMVVAHGPEQSLEERLLGIDLGAVQDQLLVADPDRQSNPTREGRFHGLLELGVGGSLGRMIRRIHAAATKRRGKRHDQVDQLRCCLAGRALLLRRGPWAPRGGPPVLRGLNGAHYTLVLACIPTDSLTRCRLMGVVTAGARRAWGPATAPLHDAQFSRT